jgi:hypothetical protein
VSASVRDNALKASIKGICKQLRLPTIILFKFSQRTPRRGRFHAVGVRYA